MPDVIALTEVFPKNKIFLSTSEEYEIQGYTHYVSNLETGRGCILYIKNSISAVEVKIDTNFKESVWCKIKLQHNDMLFIGCIYRSPNCSLENTNELLSLFPSISKMGFSHILVVGDFNFKEINWKTNMSTVSENHISTKFFECCRDSYFYQHVLEPTRERIANEPSTLDLIFTNEENMLSNLQYLPGLGKSDHCILSFDFNCYIEKEAVSFKKFNFFKGDYKAVDEGLLSIDWAQVLGGLDLSDSWDFLVDKIIQLIELYVPENRVSGQSDRENPFINQACIEAIRSKNTKWQKYKHCKSNINYDHYKAARNRVTAELRNAKYNFEQNLAAKIKTDNKLFWSYVRSKQKTKTRDTATSD